MSFFVLEIKAQITDVVTSPFYEHCKQGVYKLGPSGCLIKIFLRKNVDCVKYCVMLQTAAVTILSTQETSGGENRDTFLPAAATALRMVILVYLITISYMHLGKYSEQQLGQGPNLPLKTKNFIYFF